MSSIKFLYRGHTGETKTRTTDQHPAFS